MEKRLSQAIDLAKKGRIAEALHAFDQAIADNPDDLNAHGHRAYLLASSGKYEAALADYRFIIDRNPDDLEAHLRYAETLLKSGSLSASLDALKSVISRNPLYPGAVQTLQRAAASAGVHPTEQPEIDRRVAAGNARPINPVIQMLEESPANFPASVYPEVGQMLYSLVRCSRPRLVIETGCYVGYSSLCIAQALEDNGEGYLHSFDLFLELPPDYHSPVTDDERDALAVARAHIERAGLAHRISLHKGDSSAKILEDLKDECIDFAFIDGDHTVRGALKDWNAVLGKLRDGALVMLHDTVPANCGWRGPRYLIDIVCTGRTDQYQAIDIPTPEGFGLGLIQKIGAGRKHRWNPPFWYGLKDILQATFVLLARKGS